MTKVQKEDFDETAVAEGMYDGTLKVQFFVGGAATSTATPSSAHVVQPRQAGSQPATTLYVTDISFNAVRAISPLDATILATTQLPGTGSPLGIAITPNGKFLWVCEDSGSPGANASTIEIIDTSSLQIVGSIPLGPLVWATRIVMTPDGKTAYVTNNGLDELGNNGAVDSILVVDVASQKVTSQIMPPLLNPQHPEFGSASFSQLAVSPDGTLLYAVSAQGIFVFDTLTNTQVNPPSSSTLAIVNISTFNVAGITPTADTPIVFHPNGTRAYFTSDLCPAPNSSKICLAVMDTKTNLIVDAIPLGPSATTRASGLGISPDGRCLVVKEFNSGDWILVDPTTDKVVTTVSGEPQTNTVFFTAN